MAEKHETTRRGSSTRHRRLRALAGLAAALCVVALVGAVVPGLLAEDDAVQDVQSLLSYSQDEIQTITWTHDGTQSQVAYEDDGWVDTAGGEQLDQDEVGAIAEALADATVTRSIDEADVTDEMGLDDPSATASITFTDGTSAELRIGAPTSDEAAYYASVDDEGAYYAQPEGSSKVYTISESVVEKLTGTKVEDMLPDDVLLMDWTEVTSMEVSTGGVTKTIDFEHTRSEDDEDGDGEADVETAYTVDGQECDASEVEELLMRQNGAFISAERMLGLVWGYDEFVSPNVLWTYVSYLRRKTKSIHSRCRIEASRGRGYILLDRPEENDAEPDGKDAQA